MAITRSVLSLPAVSALFIASLSAQRVTLGDDETTLLATRYARVEAELAGADVTSLTPSQRTGRAQVIDWLRQYRERADFGVNVDFVDQRVPLFIDNDGRRCAVAFLLDRSGCGHLTQEIAATQNHAWLVELTAEPNVGERLQEWLVAHGLSATEAARIQAPTQHLRSSPPPPPRVPPPDWEGPADAMRPIAYGGKPSPSQPARRDVSGASVAARGASGFARPIGGQVLADMELEWLDWWHASRDAYLHLDRLDPVHAEVYDDAGRMSRSTARAEIIPALLRAVEDTDATVRGATTLALGRLGDESHLKALEARLHDPQQGIRYWSLLAIGSLGGARASFVLSSVAAGQRQDQVGPSARAFAVLGLGLADRRADDSLIAALCAAAPRDDHSGLPLASLLYADLAGSRAPDRLPGEITTDRDLEVRSRALERLAHGTTADAVATLTQALSGKHRELRRSAALSLGASKHALALPALQTAYDLEREHLTRGVIALAIGSHPQPQARNFLLQEIVGGPKALRPWVALGLGLWLRQNDDAKARAAVRAAALADHNDSAQSAYFLAMGLARDAEAVAALSLALQTSSDASRRLVAGEALALIGGDAARRALRTQLAADPCYLTRAALAELLCSIGNEDDVDAVLGCLHRAPDDQQRAALAVALGTRYSPSAYRVLRDIVADGERPATLRASAVHALGRMLDDAPAFRLAGLARHSNWRLQPAWFGTLVQSTL